LGADHPDTLRALGNLATTYHRLGRYQEAEPLEVTVLEKQKKVLSAGHPHTLAALKNLAATYHKLGKYQEAKELQAQYDQVVSSQNFMVMVLLFSLSTGKLFAKLVIAGAP
jgi:tetratricopeptide (TPR) repeat protein